MATLSTLSNFILNIKQTPSGKVEWTDTSLKGLEVEVKNLFSTNGVQATANTTSLLTLSGTDSLIALVEADADVTKNGMYFWSLNATVVGYNYPANGGGYWNLVKNSTTAPVSQIVAGTNMLVSPSGGTGVVTISTLNVAQVNATDKFIPYRLSGGQFADSPIKWDTSVFPQLSTVYSSVTKGLFFDFSIDQYILGKSSNQIELNGNNMITTVNSILQGFSFNTAGDYFLLGGNLSTGSSSTSSIGIWSANTSANTAMFVGSNLYSAGTLSVIGGKMKVYIPGLGYKYIQLYNS